MKKHINIFLLFFCSCFTLQAQTIPLGTWRNHLSYQSGRQVAIDPIHQKVYCATENGLFFLHTTDAGLQSLSKLDGLSENNVAHIAYTSDLQILIIVYENSNIDLVTEDEIIELPTIKNAEITESKTVNHLYIYQTKAYLSTDFGVVVVDLEKQEIQESYQNLGEDGSSLPILASAVSQDSLMLASSQGVLRASLSDNLKDFNQWQRFEETSGIPVAEIHTMVTRNNQVYAMIQETGIFKYTHQGVWSAISIPDNATPFFYQIRESEGKLLINTTQGLYIADNQDNFTTLAGSLISTPRDALQDAQGNSWIADAQNGLVSNFQGDFQGYFLNGTARADSWKVYFGNQQIIGLSGGFDTDYQPLQNNGGFYVFREGQWTNFNSFDPVNSINTPQITDLVDVVYRPFTNTTYFASFGQGLLSQTSDDTFEVFNPGTTPLQADEDGSIKASSLAVDFSGNLWVGNYGLLQGESALHVQNTDGIWQSFPSFNSASRYPLEIVIDFSNRPWIRLNPDFGGGIWVLDPQNNRQTYLGTGANSGSLPNNRVNSIAVDHEGQIWTGTDEGVAIFLDPFNVFGGVVNSVTPIFELRPLLRAEKVNIIVVDGGNRKWIGTDNGLWLFSDEGSELIYHFTEENSPLISNQVLDLAIHPKTGEVFVATAQGIVSYRGTATEGNSIHQNVTVFPNPVRPEFDGLVGISGLVENANVKITDVSGRLFYETKAQGGTATWDVTDYNGFRAQTGIYLIFSTNLDGSETLVSKIAIIK